MKAGKQFEKDFRDSVERQGIFQFRPKDCPGAWHQNKDDRPANVYFTARNEYDLILFFQGTLLTLELKSFGTTSFPFKSIRDSQVEGLLKAARYDGVVAGVVLNFRGFAKTYFIPIDLFVREQTSGPRKSINLSRAEALGIEIPQKLRRVHYSYDVLDFMGKVAVFELEDE